MFDLPTDHVVSDPGIHADLELLRTSLVIFIFIAGSKARKPRRWPSE